MTTFLDSNFFIALLNTRDEKHEEAKNKLITLKDTKFGSLVTTDYVVDEVITTIWGQTHRKDLVKKAYSLICQTPRFVQFKKISLDHLTLTWEKWVQLAEWPKRPLSFTDCTILAFMELENVEYLLTFDSEFNGLVKTVNGSKVSI